MLVHLKTRIWMFLVQYLKEILEDIGTHCYQREKENHMNVGYKILENIRDSMSDRASTEKNFNRLLEEHIVPSCR